MNPHFVIAFVLRQLSWSETPIHFQWRRRRSVPPCVYRSSCPHHHHGDGHRALHSLPHLPPRRATSFPSATATISLPVPSRNVWLRDSRLAAAALATSGVLESTNGASPIRGQGRCEYGRENFPLAAVIGQVRNSGAALPASCSLWVLC